MWHAHPQKNLPKISVARIAKQNRMKPALTYPNSRVCMDSLGSTGLSVRPFAYQCQM